MKKSQRKTDFKIQCKHCGLLVTPYIKKNNFKKSTMFVYAAYCPKCGKYIENVLRKNEKDSK